MTAGTHTYTLSYSSLYDINIVYRLGHLRSISMFVMCCLQVSHICEIIDLPLVRDIPTYTSVVIIGSMYSVGYC